MALWCWSNALCSLQLPAPPQAPIRPFSRSKLGRSTAAFGRVLAACTESWESTALNCPCGFAVVPSSRLFQRLLTQIQGPRRANKTTGSRCSGSTQGGSASAQPRPMRRGTNLQSSTRAAQLIMPQPGCSDLLGRRWRCDALCTLPCLLTAAATWFHLRDLQAPSLLVLIGQSSRESLERDWAAPFRIHSLSHQQ